MSVERPGWSLLRWVVGGAFVGAVVVAGALGVIVAASGGGGYDVSYAAGLGLALGLVIGAFVGGVAFFLRYSLGQ